MQNDRFRQLLVLCAAMALSVVMVNGGLMVLRASGSPPTGLADPLPLVLFAGGLVLLGAAPALKRAVFKRADAEGFGGELKKRLAAYQTATIVAFAFREAAGLLGFVLALTTGNLWWSWGLGGAALIAMALDWPKREHLGV